MVAVSIFAIVALITTGALITVSNTNRKAQAIKLAIDNVNFALDSMILNFREGSLFNCISGEVNESNLLSYFVSKPNDCQSGGDALVFKSERSTVDASAPYRLYYLKPSTGDEPGRLEVVYQSDCASGCGPVELTSPEVSIEKLKFYVRNAKSPNKLPNITVVLKGQVIGRYPTTFALETTVAARPIIPGLNT